MSTRRPEVVNSNQLSQYKEEPLNCQDEVVDNNSKQHIDVTTKLDYGFYDLTVSVVWYYLQNN